MNIKLKRSLRTPHSEEINIFDAETLDEHGDAVSLGKLDVHYLEDQLVGTLLIWQEYATGFNRTHPPGSDETLDTLIDAILSEVSEPIGLPTDYGVEVYFPSVREHQFVSNYADDGGEAEVETTAYDEERR